MIRIGEWQQKCRAQPVDLIRDALTNLYALRQRSLLALFGIAIGTAAIVAVLTIGHIAGLEVDKIFQDSGANMLVVRLQPPDGKTTANDTFDPAFVAALPRRLPEVSATTSLATDQTVIFKNQQPQPLSIAVADPALQDLFHLDLQAGRPLSAVDNSTLAGIIGWQAAKLFYPSRPETALGKYISVGTYNFKIVGVMRPRAQAAFDPVNFNWSVVIPMGSLRRVIAPPNINFAVIRLLPGADSEQAIQHVLAILKDSVPGDTLHVSSARQFIRTLKAQKAVQMHLLAAIGSVSLLVGGIGVMNVMLMSMMERRREIGIRAAIGAAPFDIQAMFLTEAAALAFCGGILGTMLGIGVAALVAEMSKWSFHLALYALPLGIGLAVLVGIVFGVYPAIKASQLNPIEALHAD